MLGFLLSTQPTKTPNRVDAALDIPEFWRYNGSKLRIYTLTKTH